MNGSLEVEGVPGNRWDLLVPDPAAEWMPKLRVSICIPARDSGSNLSRTIAALSVQTYPHDLMEIIVADDGSEPPLSIDDDVPFDLQIVRQPRSDRFGAGKARNLAAKHASGSILMFLDADVVPERQVVEAYARWFDRAEAVVPLGLCRFVEMSDMASSELVQLVQSGGLAAHFHGAEVDQQDWRERTFSRTGDLTREAADAFRIVIGATFAVSARQFQEIGGFRELGIRGVEDTELGYRLHTNGAVLVLDRDAVHWHQGRRNLNTERKAAIKQAREPFVSRLIPLPGFRSGVPHPLDEPVSTVPRLVVHVVDEDTERREMEEALEAARKVVPDDVVVIPSGASLVAKHRAAFAQMWLPVNVRMSVQTVPAVLDLLADRGVGVLRLTPPSGGRAIEVRTTRAHNRGRAAEMRGAAEGAAARLFGEWWVSSDSVGIVDRDRTRPPEAAAS